MSLWWPDGSEIDFSSLPELISADNSDEIIINDISAGLIKKIIVGNLLISNFPDFVISNDLSLVFANDGGFVFKG